MVLRLAASRTLSPSTLQPVIVWNFGALQPIGQSPMRNPAKAMNACEKAEQWQVALEVFKSISASPSEACQQSLVCVFFCGCMILNTIMA